MACMCRALLADVCESFRIKCLEIYELDPAYFLQASALAWQACLKKIEVKLELLTNANMLLMVENDLRGGTRHAVHRYVQICNKCERLIQLQPSQTSYTGMSTIYLDGQCHKSFL